MPGYQVRREIETVGTARAASTGAAKDAAEEGVVEALLAADDVGSGAVEVVESDVFEFPSAPFDPYRIDVRAAITVSVDAGDEGAAIAAGQEAIGALLAQADLDEWSYAGEAEIEPDA